MKVTVLGTGTSQGIPVIGCDCPVCLSTDPRDRRLRSSILLQEGETTLLVDAGPDLRQQMLTHDIRHVDAVFLTHEHTDHIIGMDDLRPFMFMQRRPLPIYAIERVLTAVQQRFAYAFEANPYPGAPRYDLHTVGFEDEMSLGSLRIQCFKVMHGTLPISALRAGRFAYVTDAKSIPESSMDFLRDLDVLILDCLRLREHHSHMHLDLALDLISRVQPKRTFLTHISHDFGRFGEIEDRLPPGVLPAWDGLTLEL